jgi:hypothetical protein
MNAKTPFLHVIIAISMVLVLEAREPIKSPPARPQFQQKTIRARDLGIPFDGTPEKLDAILTDRPP